jgi:hypothetical protein
LHGASTGGASVNEIVFCWAMMLIFSAIYLLISSRLFQKMLVKARVDATLDME